ncbi:MAG TPA: ABC transporter permease [Candidatus Pelethosoma merdigallinarum]|nr:ABC transporter permease [Candidatus Pelethosoma merdigallinarum]
MKNKLKYLTAMSLKRKIQTKWFVAANILIALVIICGINIDTIITAFGGDFDKQQPVYIADHTGVAFDSVKTMMNESSKALNTSSKKSSFDIQKTDKNEKEIKEQVDKKDGLGIIIENDKESTLKVTIISKDILDAVDSQLISNAINQTKTSLALADSGISNEQISSIYSSAKIDYEYTKDDVKKGEEGTQMLMQTVFPIVILPFFMLTLFLVQMIGAEVNDEKTTRGMEIIISNVSPKVHFFSKVIAGNLFVLFQGVLLFLYGGLGLLVRNLIGGSDITGGIGSEVGKAMNDILSSSIGSQLAYIIPLTLLLMIITFVAYSLLAGILASMTTNIEDFQQLQTPIVIISLVGYYLAMLANVFGGSLFIKILGMVPFISAILAPSLLVLGQFSILEMLLAIVLCLLTVFALIKYGLRIYKVGILNYSSKDLWKKMFKALKN